MNYRVFAIAVNTFKEGIRAKVLYNLLFFAGLLMAFSVLLAQLSIGETTKVMMDFGLFSISLFGVLIAVFVGIGLVYKEIEKRTIYTIISKPIERSQFLFGKYLGLTGILITQLIIMWAFFLLVLYIFGGVWHFETWVAIWTIFLEFMVITAFALFFSSFSSPFLSALFTMSIYLIGHSTSELRGIGSKLDGVTRELVLGFCRIFDLNYFNLSTEVVHGMPISLSRVLNATAYCLALCVVLLMVSQWIFSRRDFK